MSNKIERRVLQIRASEGNDFCLVGRALSYNEISSNELYPGMRERIMPGAFKESLASGKDVKALLNHDSTGLPLGRLANGTLKLTDSDEGLDMRVQLDKNNSSHRDVYASVKRGDISEMSFAFACEDEDVSSGFTRDGAACQIRNVKKAQLFDVSVVTSPFYADGATSVDARSTDAAFRASMAERLAAIDEKYAANILNIQMEARAKKVARDMEEPAPDSGYEDVEAIDDSDDRELQLMQDCLNRAHGKYRVVGKSDSYLYAVDDDENCHRWA
jgi:uncharacterized protein